MEGLEDFLLFCALEDAREEDERENNNDNNNTDSLWDRDSSEDNDDE